MAITVIKEVKELPQEQQDAIKEKYGPVSDGAYVKGYTDAVTGEYYGERVFNKDGEPVKPKKVGGAAVNGKGPRSNG